MRCFTTMVPGPKDRFHPEVLTVLTIKAAWRRMPVCMAQKFNMRRLPMAPKP